MVAAPIPLTLPARAPRERAYLEAALERGHLHGDGPLSSQATALLARVLDGAPVLLTTSCTHALELMALLFELQHGDEVVLPSFTFPSTANAFALRGCRLRFADVDELTWSAERPQIEAALTPATKAIVTMGYGGVQRDVLGLEALCRERGLLWGEDAAHGLFARHNGRALGTVGALGALSFHSTKNVTCGEGGALVINDPALRQRAELLREKGTDRASFLRGEVPAYRWQDIGSSYLPSEILGALLCAHLEHAPTTQAARQAVVAVYADVIGAQAQRLGISLQHQPVGAEGPAHLFAVLVAPDVDRAEVIAGMRERGVVVASHYEPLHRAPAASRCADPVDLPTTDDVARRLLRLPLHAQLSVDDAHGVATTFLEVVERVGRRR
jgi:dTDP-4-amino-4,6-dideoxygalactose transaminase